MNISDLNSMVYSQGQGIQSMVNVIKISEINFGKNISGYNISQQIWRQYLE